MTVAMNYKTPDVEMAHADVIESSVGVCRRWQIMVFLLVFLVNTPLALQELSIVMLAAPADVNCSNKDYSTCAKECPSYEWDKSVFHRTITMEWDLICDREWIENFAQTILMAGILVGNFGFGIIADRYGRRKPLIAAVILEMITGIALSFSTYLPVFLVLRFLVACAAGGTLCTSFVLVVEIIGKQYRSTFGILFQMTYYFGHALLGVIGYFIRDWRYFQLTISLPVCLLLSYYWLVPESPRWLLSVGKYEQAIIQMEKAAKINKMPTENIRSNVMSKLKDIVPAEENCLDLFRSPNVRRKTICIFINWSILGLCFFGVAQYIGKLAGNIFLNTAVAGLIQIPGNVLIIYTIKKWGRKATLMATYTLGGVSMLLITVIPTEPTWPTSFCGCVGMMGMSLSFATAFVWSGELFATPVRNVGMGTAATCAKIGSMIAPFLDQTKKYHYWLPPLIFGIGPFIAIGVSLWLPETLNQKMPDSTDEAERFGKKVKDEVPPTEN